MKRIYKTNFLVGNPSFLVGMGTIFNLGGNFFNYRLSTSEAMADGVAIHNDWAMVGQDIGNSIMEFEEDQKTDNQLSLFNE